MGFNAGNIVTYDQIEPRTREWLWDGFILSADVTAWIADGGTGKGLASADVCARMTTGRPMPPESADDPYTDPETWAPPGYVIVAALEDDPDMDTVNRLAAAGADMRYVIDLSTVEIDSPTGTMSDTFQLPRDVPYAEAAIRHFSNPENEGVLPGGVRLVIIDPFMSAASGSVAGNQASRAVLRPLRQLARKTGVGVLLIHHFHKGSRSKNARSGSLVDYVGGSKGLTDDLRCSIALLRDEADDRIVRMLTLKSNVGKADPVAFMVKVDGPDTRVIWGQPRHTAADSRARLEARIMRVITNRSDAGARPLNPIELAALLDISHREVTRALAALARDGRATSGRLGWLPAPALTA